jgi:hypothetical protein
MSVSLYQGSLVMIPHPQIAGDGLALAQAIAHNAATQNALLPLAQIPQLGDIPPNFNSNLPNYNHGDILQLVIFYNDNFGIVQVDTVRVRIDKFRRFLTEI